MAAFLGGCGGGDDSSTRSTSTASSSEPAKGAKAVLAGVGSGDLSGVFTMPGFPYGDETRITAKGVGPAHGEREYVIWGTRGDSEMVVLGTWPAGPNGNLEVHDDVSTSKLLSLLSQGPTRMLISRANTDRLWAAIAKEGGYTRPSYIGTEVLEGLLTGPGVDAANSG